MLPSFISERLEAVTMNSWNFVMMAMATLMGAVMFIRQIFLQQPIGSSKFPPMIKSPLPYLGSIIAFGRDPPGFIRALYNRYGEAFTFLMLGRKMTYLIGNDGHAFFFNAKESDLSAAEAYAPLTVPVFGKGVVYDVSYNELLEQKKIVKSGLSTERFKAYVPMIEEETQQFLKRWGDEGTIDILQAMEELIVMTASRCLMGPEIRACLNEKVAQYLWDLDKGFTPINMLFSKWPLPNNRLRDRAHANLAKLFKDIMAKRRVTGNDCNQKDMLHTLMTATYKDNTRLTDDQSAHMLIALLLAGQHTSSATGAWLSLFLAHYPDYQIKCFDEQKDLFGDDFSTLDYDTLKDAKVLENCIKEVLRLRPPIITMMRKVLKDQVYKNYIIPKGHYVCVSPTVAQLLEECTSKPLEFRPERFETEYTQVGNVLETGDDDSDKTTASSANRNKYMYFPFGAGRHRCIGEYFAFVQVKTIISTLLRTYELFPQGPLPAVDRTTLVSVPERPALLKYRRRTQ